MARNRKYRTAAVRYGPPIKAGILCLSIIVCGTGYVWQKKKIGELSKEITRREDWLNQFRQQNDKLKRQLAELLNPRLLDERGRNMKLGLGPPNAAQILRLPEPAGEPAGRSAERRLALNPAELPEW